MFGYAKPVPYNPYNLRNQKWGEAIVAGSGPLTNIVLAVVFGLGIRFSEELGLPFATVQLLVIITHVNILLALFNMIPIPPLDGSKVLMSVLPYRGQMAMRRFEEMFMQYALVSFFLFIFLFYTVLSVPLALFINFVFALITGSPLF
jgi:Zn-dependent protease